jgi:Dehydrogenases with different specificities (related to short-chain alcohol dehydrogenases)
VRISFDGRRFYNSRIEEMRGMTIHMKELNVKNLFNLNGKVAIITGGAQGLGLQACQALAEAGADIVLTSRTIEKSQNAAYQLSTSQNVKALGLSLDVTSENSWNQLVDGILEAFGRIDILINNAGGRRVSVDKTNQMEPGDLFLEGRSLADWQYTMDVNLTGVFLGCRAVAPVMKKARSGKIINLASIDGIRARDLRIYKDTGLSPTVPDYLACKAGVINLTKGIAVALAPYGINVNAISPGGFFRGQPEEFVKNYEYKVPLGRMGRDGIDLKGAVVFCASAASDYMVGHNLVIDGGFTIWS